MAQGSRPDRVADQIRAEVTDLLAREVHDPGIGFITITHVQVSADLQHARVYYTILGDQKARRDTERALGRAATFLRKQIGRRLRLKRIPELEFRFDESIEQHDRISRLLQELSDQSVPPDAPGPPADTGEHAAKTDDADDTPH